MSAQLDLIARVPKRGTMEYELLAALQNGERLTPAIAYEKYHCLSLSQRIGEFKRQGWPILSRMIELATGKRVAQYWIERCDAQPR